MRVVNHNIYQPAKKAEIKQNISTHLEAILTHIDGNATLKIPVFLSIIPKVNKILNDAMKKYKLEKAVNDKANEQNSADKSKSGSRLHLFNKQFGLLFLMNSRPMVEKVK
jgi:hypothetical protein